MRKVYSLLAVLCFMLPALAQKNGSIRGIAFDTISKQAVASATVSVMDKKDSSLITFTMTDNGGRFELRGIPNGDYRLLITHVSYHSSNTFFSIDDNNKARDFGNVTMNDLTKVLAEVVVKNEEPPVTLIGDTVQYNAGSFKTVPNANVEQLLKKLPGVKVDKDGTVTAQGEKVNRVLVDGKEFFGNDPKIATRNLPADAVDKVQVYDRQSDQAQLTGFEDGNYEKTINLKLKKDKKKGVFGKVNAGAGTDDRYEGKFNVNSFKGARQMSAIGMGNNTNAEGFSFMDILSFTGALSQMRQAGGGGNININMSAADAAAMGLNAGNNGGINTAWGGGLNYNNIIGKKLDMQSNYFYNRYNPNIKTHLLRQNILPTGSNFYEEDSYADNLNNTHRFNLNLLYQIDSMHSLRIVPSFSYQNTDNNSIKNFNTTKENGDMINDGVNKNISSSEGYNFRNDITFRKKFRRKGRTFSLLLGTSLNETSGDGDIQSIVNYYTSGAISKRDTTNQRNETEGDLKGYNLRGVYTEPLWKRTLMEFSAGRSNTTSTSGKTTWNYNKLSGKYDQVNQLLTNDYENTYGYTTAGFRMRKQGRKYSYSLGFTWQHAELQGKIISGVKDSLISKDFKNILPNASFKYNFSRFRSLTINYSANTNQPTMQQLQPVPDNSNPLYIRDGNPDLKQEFTHAVRANLNLLSPYKNRNLFVNLQMMGTENKIVNYDIVNPNTGVRITKPVNVNGVYNIGGNISYSMPIPKIRSTFEIRTMAGYNNNKQYINLSENTIRTVSLGPELRLDMNVTDRLTWSAGADYRINSAKYSLESSLNNKYFSQEYQTSVEWQLPRNFFFATEFTYTINSRRAEGFNGKIPLWIASVSKQFMKYNRGEVKLSAFDLLNRIPVSAGPPIRTISRIRK